jgi:peptidoglycan/xylan/chitin deacetylase (PgdA/CDA1 family)
MTSADDEQSASTGPPAVNLDSGFAHSKPSRRAVLATIMSAGLSGCTARPLRSAQPSPTVSRSPKGQTPTAAGTPSPTPSPLTTTGPDIKAGSADTRSVALTFHGAGSTELARLALTIAAQHQAQFTVLAVGLWLSANKGLGRDIIAAGHDLGNHTWSHQVMPRLSLAEASMEIGRGADAVAAVRGQPGDLFRPSGTPASTATIRTAARAHGYHRCLSYGVDPLDYLDPGAHAVRVRTIAQISAGAIVSLHLGHPGTIEALPGILTALADRNLQAVTATTLLGDTS